MNSYEHCEEKQTDYVNFVKLKCFLLYWMHVNLLPKCPKQKLEC